MKNEFFVSTIIHRIVMLKILDSFITSSDTATTTITAIITNASKTLIQ